MEVDVDNMVRMNTDALALLGNTSFETSQIAKETGCHSSHAAQRLRDAMCFTCAFTLHSIIHFVVNVSATRNDYYRKRMAIALAILSSSAVRIIDK